MYTNRLLIFSLMLALFFASCRKSETPSEPNGLDVFGLTDETQEAGKMVREINDDELKKIKAIYKESEAEVEELKAAIQNKEVEKVKKLATGLVRKINDGINLANDAAAKLAEARQLKINADYEEYLDKKEQALKKQIEAFEIRFEQTRYLRDEFQINDKKEIDEAKKVLGDMDEKFKRKMEAARELSQEANLIAKESMRKQN